MQDMKNCLLLQKGFTLIELLVVMAILGILVTGLMVAINPIDKIHNATDARMETGISGIARAAELYSIQHMSYPESTNFLSDLVNAGELKSEPETPSGYTYTFTTLPGCTTTASDCASFTVYTTLKSIKWGVNNRLLYDSSTGVTCFGVDQTNC